MSKIISTGYGLAIAIFIAISLFSYVNTAQLIHHIEVRTRSFAIIERLEVLLTDVMNAEMGRHDYVITGEKQHLVFYRNSAAAAERGLQEVRALVSGDPDQERRLAELEYQVKRRIANLDASIAFHRQRGFDAAAQRSFTDEGNRIYQSIEKTFNEMKNIERRMLRESGAAQKAFATRTLSTIIAGTLLGFGILFWITYSLNRVVIEKVRAESSLRESRDFLEKIMQSVTNAIYVLDRNDTFVQVNRSIGSITGYEGNELVGKPFSVLFDPDTLPRMHELFEKVCVHGLTLFHQETEIVRKDGSRRIVSLSAAPLFENSTVVGVIGAAEDITERKQAEKRLSEYIGELEARNREIGILSEMGSMLQACASSEECVSLIARWAERLFSEDSGAVYLINGQRDILEAVILWGESLPDERSITTQDCWALRMGRPYSAEISRKGMVCPHIKHEVTSALLCIPMVAQGEILGLLHLVPDGGWSGAPEERREHIMKSKEKLAETVAESIGLSVANFRLRETLFQQSIHDPLTGLYNRRYMDGLLQKELHRMERRGLPLGIIMLDLDHFKGFNDTFGHEAGDMLLREFGVFLKRNIREEDYACRYGGEEFVVLLPETGLESARQRAEQLRERIKGMRIPYQGRMLDPITLSLGIAVYPKDGKSAVELLRAADSALYRAKAEGRDRVMTLS